MTEEYKELTNNELLHKLINSIIEFGDGETEFHTRDIQQLILSHKELVEMLESINTIMWESGMIKGRETNVTAIMQVLEKFSSKY